MTLLTDKVDELFTDWNKIDSPGCAIAIIKDGEVIHSRGYGMANLEHDIPISTTSVFDVGSISKQFVAMSIALLARQNKLSLNDRIQKYLPEIWDYQQPITIHHLIHHTSGLRDYIVLMDLCGFCWDNHCPHDEIMSLICRQPELNFPPGTEYLYSNTGYLLLGEIIKRVSGKSLRGFTDEHIFAPLKMNSTHFRDDFREIIRHRATAYKPRDSGGFEIDMSHLDVVGDGGLHTTVEDLCLWDANFYQNAIGGYGQDLIDETISPGKLNNGKVLNYAFGLGVRSDRGLKRIFHNGASSGYVSEMCRFPEQRFSVICLSNLSSVNTSSIVHQIWGMYLAEDFTETKKSWHNVPQFTERAIAELETKTGLYLNTKNGAIWELKMQGGKLIVDAAGFSFQVVPGKLDRYHSVGTLYDIKIEFEQQNSKSSSTMSFWIGNDKLTDLEKFEPYTLSRDALVDYVGEYFCPELDIKYRLSLEGRQLKIDRYNLPTAYLEQISRSLFKEADNCFDFSFDDRDRVLGFNLNAGGGLVRSIYFAKQPA